MRRRGNIVELCCVDVLRVALCCVEEGGLTCSSSVVSFLFALSVGSRLYEKVNLMPLKNAHQSSTRVLSGNPLTPVKHIVCPISSTPLTTYNE